MELVYRAEDLDGFDAGATVGEPGEYPFTRGIQPTMVSRATVDDAPSMRAWAMPKSRTNGISFCWRMGPRGLSVAFDLPTQIGYDSDSPLALGEVGKVGVAIDSIEDMQRLFDGIALDTISTSMTINATASILLALYVAVAKRTGANVKKAEWDDSERYFEGVHCAGDLYLSGDACDAAGDGYLRVGGGRGSGVEYDLDLRLSHARGRMHGGAGGGVYRSPMA